MFVGVFLFCGLCYCYFMSKVDIIFVEILELNFVEGIMFEWV